MAEADWDGDVAVLPYRCERCGERDHGVRLYESCKPTKVDLSEPMPTTGPAYRLMQLHAACWRQWQGEVELGLAP